MIRRKVLWVSLALLLISAVAGLIVGIRQTPTEHMISACALLMAVWVTVQTGVSAALFLVNLLAMFYYKKGLYSNREHTDHRTKSEYHADLAVTYLLATLLVALVGFSVCFGTSILIETIRYD